MKLSSLQTFKRSSFLLAVALALGTMAHADTVRVDNDWLAVGGKNRAIAVGEDVSGALDGFFQVSSGSAPTLKVSGLPSGVKFDARTQTFSGAPSKAGVYYVTCSAKNKNGYSHSFISVWTVGGASNGDYDDIGIDWDALGNWEKSYYDEASGRDVCPPVEWVVGEKVSIIFLYAIHSDAIYGITASGLPSGLSVPKCPSNAACGFPPGMYRGTLAKAGKYKVTVTAKYENGKTCKAVKTIIVQDSGCRYLNVVSTSPSRGTATGSKVYAIGAKASISAKAAKGYYFAGWYRDANFQEPLEDTASGDWRKASDSIVVTTDIAETGIYARFVSRSEDSISIDCGDTWNVETHWSDTFDINVRSASLPAVTIKGLPAGVTWNKSRFVLESTSSKLKPGTAIATITAKNLSGRTATKDVRVVVPNIQSDVFSGLDYSSDAYSLTLGVSDLCIAHGWLEFNYADGFTVSASGLPPGLSLATYDGSTAYVRGTPTKSGVYTITLTAKRGNISEKATFTINIVPLPEYAVGTFNGVLRDETSGEIVGSFTFTAAATGKQSVKVVTALGTMSLSEPTWNCYDDEGRPTAYFSKYSKNENFWFMLTPQNGANWDCEHQLEGSLTWRRSSAGGESNIEAVIETAQRNAFGKTGKAYDHPAAGNIVESLASEYKSAKMVMLWDSELDAYTLGCADCVAPGFGDGTATLKMNKNGTATISGKLYDLYSFSATSTLTFDTSCGDYGSYLFGEHCYAIFTPVVKMKMCAHSTSGDKCFTTNELVPIYWRPLDE